MRKYKFRCWYRNKMRYDITGFEFYGEGNLSGVFIDGDFADEIELMQYTGLHDKNGKEIYEGDILKLHYIKNGLEEIKANVIYSEDYAQYVIKDTGYVSDDYEPLCDYEDLEVIGNIYDNAELLKGADNIE